jgi:hypothetical protein
MALASADMSREQTRFLIAVSLSFTWAIERRREDNTLRKAAASGGPGPFVIRPCRRIFV